MNCSKLLPSIFAVFAFIFLYEYLIHGVCLQGIYAQTSELWRTPEAMNDKMHFMMLSQLLFAASFTLFYCHLRKKTNDTLTGLTYGSYVGAILAVVQIGLYAYMPISFLLMAYWVISTFIESLLAGLILSIVWKCSFCVKKV